MRKSVCVLIVAVQLVGCGQFSALRQGGATTSHYSRVRNHIVQSGGGSQWVVITPPAPNGISDGIAQGPDGNMWFTQLGLYGTPSLVGYIDMSAVVTEYSLGSGHAPVSITAGSDGAVWFSDYRAIGRITTSGIITEYSISNPHPDASFITLGPDGNVWFLDDGYSSVGKITPQGVITEYKLPKANVGRGLYGITGGPDGNVWFTLFYRNKIGMISPSGQFKFFIVPTPSSGPRGIALGGDGNLYFTEQSASKIGEITPHGRITEFAVPSHDVPTQITRGFSGTSMWFIDDSYNSRSTQLRQFLIQSKTFTQPIIAPYSPAGFGNLHAGPDGNMWITDSIWYLGNIDVFVTHVLTTIPASVQISGVGQTQTVQIHETQNKGGSYTAVSSDQSIATVGPVGQGNSFVVTAQGVGSCTIRVSDSIGNYIDVPVTVQ